jgi:DNA-directed RNA polymerase specialized sigma subunit
MPDRQVPAPTQQFLAGPFVGYAVPTIIGALKRYFRDSTWAMRVPRGTKAMVLQLRTATDNLSQLRGQPPTPTELAAHLHVRVKDVWAATLAAQAYRLESLDTPRMRDDDHPGGRDLSRTRRLPDRPGDRRQWCGTALSRGRQGHPNVKA